MRVCVYMVFEMEVIIPIHRNHNNHCGLSYREDFPIFQIRRVNNRLLTTRSCNNEVYNEPVVSRGHYNI